MRKEKQVEVEIEKRDMRFICAYMTYFSTLVQKMGHPMVADEMAKIGELMYADGQPHRVQAELDVNLTNIGVCKWFAADEGVTMPRLRSAFDFSNVEAMKARRAKSPIVHEVTMRDLRYAWALMHLMSILGDELSSLGACEGMAQAIQMIIDGKANPEHRAAPAIGAFQMILGCKWYADGHISLERFLQGDETIQYMAQKARKLIEE